MKVKKNIPEFIAGMQTWFMVEFIDEGIPIAVNNLIEKAGVNTLLIGTHLDRMSTKNFGKLGHNKTRSEQVGEGFFYNFNISKYKDTKIKPVRNTQPETQNIDVFSEVLKESKKIGIQCYALMLHRFPNVENYPELHMRAVNGDKVPTVLCHHQPEVRRFYKCMIDDLMDRYEIDGFCFALLDHYHQFGFEALTDELADFLGIKRFSNPEMGLSCFCNVCEQRAKQEGIDVEGIRQGLLKGIKLGWIPHGIERATAAGDVFRLLIDVPEYLEWLRFRSSLFTELHNELKDYVEAKNRETIVALNIYGASDSWKYQANYKDITNYCDWIKPMFYSGTYPGTPLTPEMIGAETKRSVEGASSGARVIPGISGLVSESEERVTASIKEAIKNGASGIILSWDYSLIPYNNMKVFKDTLRELKKI